MVDSPSISIMSGHVKAPSPVKPAPGKQVQPWALTRLDLRADLVAYLKVFVPDVHHDVVQLENIRTYALAEIAALPDDTKAVEVKIESQIGPGARQANVIVFKKI